MTVSDVQTRDIAMSDYLGLCSYDVLILATA